MASIPNMRVYLPSDRHQTALLMEALLEDEKPAYIRVGRNAVEDVYEEGNVPFVMDKANVLARPEGKIDVLIVACGEMVRPSLEEIQAEVIDMYCVKPLDLRTLLGEAESAGLVLTVEEHSPFGGLGSMVSMIWRRFGKIQRKLSGPH